MGVSVRPGKGKVYLWETLEVVCGGVGSSRAHRTSRAKRVERGEIFQ